MSLLYQQHSLFLCSSLSANHVCLYVYLEEVTTAFLHLQLFSLPPSLPIKDFKNDLNPYKSTETEVPLGFTKEAAAER